MILKNVTSVDEIQVEKLKNCVSIFSEIVKYRLMKFSGVIDLLILVCLTMFIISVITFGLPEVKKKLKNFRLLSFGKLYDQIKSLSKCPKLLKPMDVESTSGYFKKKFEILNFRCF
jgi:hypothetical protein